MRPDQMPRQPFLADQDLAGLHEDVREAVEYVERWVRDDTDWQKVRAELLRLAHGHKTALAAWRDAEAELEALKRKNAEAPVVSLLPETNGYAARVADVPRLKALSGQRAALLPVGGE